MRARLVTLLLCLSIAVPVIAQDVPWYEKTKISAVAFGDYYYVVSHHTPTLEGRNGFWFRRIYLTFDQTLSDKLSARIRFEANHPGDFTNTTALEPFVKDAYVRWQRTPSHRYSIGILPTPTWELVEQVWGLRHVQKTLTDLQRMGSSRDFGLSLEGTIGESKIVSYHATVGNGVGVGADDNEGKLAALAFNVRPIKPLVFQIYGDFNDRDGETDRTMLKGFAAWQTDRARVGIEYASQKVERGTAGKRDLDAGSVFAVVNVAEKVAVFGRVDRIFDANPDGPKIPYLPIDPTTEADLYLAGLEVAVHKNVRFAPNIEVVRYDKSDLESDVIPRATFFFSF